jgi:hypothetical protein
MALFACPGGPVELPLHQEQVAISPDTMIARTQTKSKQKNLENLSCVDRV